MSQHARRAPWWRMMIGMTLALAGCGGATDDLPRQAVSGSVSLDGKPLKQGSIRFTPEDPQAQAVQAGAVIADGAYSIPSDEGPVPGKYRVAISSVAEGSEAADDAAGPGLAPRLAKEAIPERYNAQSTLTAEVTEGGSNTFDFPLESK